LIVGLFRSVRRLVFSWKKCAVFVGCSLFISSSSVFMVLLCMLILLIGGKCDVEL